MEAERGGLGSIVENLSNRFKSASAKLRLNICSGEKYHLIAAFLKQNERTLQTILINNKTSLVAFATC